MAGLKITKKWIAVLILSCFFCNSLQLPVWADTSATLTDQNQWVPTVDPDQSQKTSEDSSTTITSQTNFENSSPLSAVTPQPTSEQIIQDHLDEASQTVNNVTVSSTILDFGPIETKLKETISALKVIMKSLTDALTDKGDDVNDVKKAEDDFNSTAGNWMKELYGRVLSAGRLLINSIDGTVAGVVGLGAAATQTITYQNLKIDLKSNNEIKPVQDLMLDAVKEDPVAGQILKPQGIGLLRPGTLAIHTTNPQQSLEPFLSLNLQQSGQVAIKYGPVITGQGHIEIVSRISECVSAPCPIAYDYRLVIDSFSHPGYQPEIDLEADPSGNQLFLIKKVVLNQIPAGVSNGVAIMQQTIFYENNLPVLIQGDNFSCPTGQSGCTVETAEKGHEFEYRMEYVDTLGGFKVSKFSGYMKSWTGAKSAGQGVVDVPFVYCTQYDNQGRAVRNVGVNGYTENGVLKTTLFATDTDYAGGIVTSYFMEDSEINYFNSVDAMDDWQSVVDLSTIKQQMYWSGGVYNSQGYLYSVYSARDQNGNFVARQTTAPYHLIQAQGHIVVGQPDVLSGETDDIKVNGSDTFPEGVTVGLGIASEFAYAGHFAYDKNIQLGLTFYDGDKIAAVIDFPREDTILLRGKYYQVSIDANAKVVLTEIPVGVVTVPGGVPTINQFMNAWEDFQIEVTADGNVRTNYASLRPVGKIEKIDVSCIQASCPAQYKARFENPWGTGHQGSYIEILIEGDLSGQSAFSVQSYTAHIVTLHSNGTQVVQHNVYSYSDNRIFSVSGRVESADGEIFEEFTTVEYERVDDVDRVKGTVWHATIVNPQKSSFKPITMDSREDRIYNNSGQVEKVIRIESNRAADEVVRQATGTVYDTQTGDTLERYEVLATVDDLLNQIPSRDWNELVSSAQVRTQFYNYFIVSGFNGRNPGVTVYSKKDLSGNFVYWASEKMTWSPAPDSRYLFDRHFIVGEPDAITPSESDDIYYQYAVDLTTYPDAQKYSWGMGIAQEAWPPKSPNVPADEYPYLVAMINKSFGIYFTDKTVDPTLGYMPIAATVDYPAEDTFILGGKTYRVSLNAEGKFVFAELPALPVSVFSIPKSAEEGGVDVNILDWSASGSTAYRIYRRIFGTDNWMLIGQTSQGAIRYIDTTIDSSHAYQYEIRPVNENNIEQPAVPFSQSANYEDAYNGLQPKNVLVLMNLNDLGYVNIADEVEGYQTSNGKLDPLAEADLLRYLGLTQSAWQDSDGDGVFVITDWNVIKKADGTIEVPLGVYYGMRRDIPLTNLVFLSGITTAERAWVDFQNQVINPIRAHMSAQGITDQITAVMSVFRFPITGGSGSSWENSMTTGLRNSFIATGHLPANAANANESYYFEGRPISRQLGDGFFVATRLDAQDIRTTRRMIDDSIWAEENYHFDDPNWIANESNLRAFFDYAGAYYDYDSNFILAAEYALQSGYFSKPGDLSCDVSRAACSLQNFLMGPDYKNLSTSQQHLQFILGEADLQRLIDEGILKADRSDINKPIEEVRAWMQANYPDAAPYVMGYLENMKAYNGHGYIYVWLGFGQAKISPMIQAGLIRAGINGLQLEQGIDPLKVWIESNLPQYAEQLLPIFQQLDADFMSQYDVDINGRLDNTFLRIGWYEWLQFQDYYDFARGAIAWNLDSSNGTQMRQSPDFLRFSLLTAQHIPPSTTAESLWSQVQSRLPGQVEAISADALENLNHVLMDVQLFEKWKSVQTSVSRITDVATDQMMRNLLQEIESYKNQSYDNLTEAQKAAIVTLNTLLLFHYEMNYDGTELVHRQYSWSGVADQWWSAGFINDLYASDGQLLKRGAVATLAAIDEPGLGGVDRPDNYAYYLMQGYSFGELASGKANGSVSLMAYNGDALYRPFPLINNQIEILRNEQGQMTGYRLYLEQRLETNQTGTALAPATLNAYREYDISGRLVKEQISAAKSIVYLENGMAVISETASAPVWANAGLGSRYEETKVIVYAQDGSLLAQVQLPAIYAGLEHYEAVLLENGAVEFHLIYNDSGNVKVFNQAGELIRIDLSETGPSKILLGPLATASATEEIEMIGADVIYRSAELGEFLGVRKDDGTIEFNLPETSMVPARKLIIRLSQMQGGLGYFLSDYKLEKLNDAGQVTEFKAQQLDSRGYILTSEEDNSAEYRKTTCSGIVGFKSGVALCSVSTLQYQSKPAGPTARAQFTEEYKQYDATGTVIKNLMVGHHVNIPAGRAPFYYATYSEVLFDGNRSVYSGYSETEDYLASVASLADHATLLEGGSYQNRQTTQMGEYGMIDYQVTDIWKDGQMRPYLVMRLTENYEYEYFVVRGDPDGSAGSRDDIRVGDIFSFEQEVNGYWATWQIASVGWDAQGHLFLDTPGLNFWKGTGRVFVEYPAVSTIRLEGIDYQINFDAEGAIQLSEVLSSAASVSPVVAVSPVVDFRLQRDAENKKVMLAWNKEDGMKYEIQLSTTADFSGDIQTVVVDGSAYELASADQTRYYRIRAVSSSGTVSTWSSPLTIDSTVFAFEDVMALLDPVLS